MLGGGDDNLTLGTGSRIAGTIDGGGGINAATLTGRGSDANISSTGRA